MKHVKVLRIVKESAIDKNGNTRPYQPESDPKMADACKIFTLMIETGKEYRLSSNKHKTG